MNQNRVSFRLIIFVFLLSIPSILGWGLQGRNLQFSGLILNPIDGYSYFAKMQQGAEGNWLFQLPFTAQPGEGSLLFVFYLLLGHISRITFLSIPLIYHLTRIASGFFLFFQISALIDGNIALKNLSKNQTHLFITFSSGMGWIALVTGYIATDFWVAEAYPFFSALISPHFTLGMALFLWIINHVFSPLTIGKRALLVLFSSSLSLTMPFGSVILCMVVGLCWAADKQRRATTPLLQILLLFIPAGLLLGTQYLETIMHPQLSIWNQQNVTESPPVWDLILGFSPMMLLTIFSLWDFKKFWQKPGYRLSLIWFASSLVMVMLPFSLQRRFLFGFSIPVTILGLYLLDQWLGKVRYASVLRNFILSLPLISIGMLYMIMGFSILQRSPYVYHTVAELEAYSWIDREATKDLVVLSDELHALKIPAMTGQSVFYGHPFETIDAQTKKAQLIKLLSCDGYTNQAAYDFLIQERVNVLLLPTAAYVNASCLHEFDIVNQNQQFVYLAIQE